MNDSSRRSRVWRLLATLSPLVQLKEITAGDAQNAAKEWVSGNDGPLRDIAQTADTKYHSIAEKLMEFTRQ